MFPVIRCANVTFERKIVVGLEEIRPISLECHQCKSRLTVSALTSLGHNRRGKLSLEHKLAGAHQEPGPRRRRSEIQRGFVGVQKQRSRTTWRENHRVARSILASECIHRGGR